MLPKEKTIQNRKQLKEWLKCEKQMYKISDGLMSLIIQTLDISERHILYKHQILLRKAEYYKNTKKKLMAIFYRTKLMKMQNKYAIHVPLNCCGKGFHIRHLGPVLINGNSSVGENCCFHVNTMLVAGGTNDGAPQIGDSVVVGVGAVVLGPVKVANNVAIGANAVVNRDVLEENVAVAGVPAKIISKNGTKEWNKKAKAST